jgi:hypothetical protein
MTREKASPICNLALLQDESYKLFFDLISGKYHWKAQTSFISHVNQLSRTKIPPEIILEFLRSCINEQWTIQQFNSNLKNWKTDNVIFSYLKDWSKDYIQTDDLQKDFPKSNLSHFKLGLHTILSEPDISLQKLQKSYPVYIPETRLNRFRNIIMKPKGRGFETYSNFCEKNNRNYETIQFWVDICNRIGSQTGKHSLVPVTQILQNILIVRNEFYAVNIGNIFDKSCFTNINKIWEKTEYKDDNLHFGKFFNIILI